MPKRLSDKQAQGHAERQKSAKARQRIADMQSVLDLEGGRRLLHWILFDPDMGRLHGASFDPSVKYASEMSTAWYEGRRALARAIHEQALVAAPGDVLRMQEEQITVARHELAFAQGEFRDD